MRFRTIVRGLPASVLAASLCAGSPTFAAPATLAPAAEEIKLDAAFFEGLGVRTIGPAAMSGRISAIDAYRATRLTLLVGSASGGLWKSVDGGVTFKPIFDKHCQSIGSVRVAPSDTNTIWVGTGEPWTRNSVSIGDGVYRSIDGGANWERMGLEKTERIADIIVDPGNKDRVFVAALGHLWNANPDRGLYRTLDGGKTWEKVLYVDEETGCADVAMDPSNPDILYASMWQFRRKPWTFVSGGPGSALYRSMDGGKSWSRLTKGLPTGLLGRIAVAPSPAKPERVYAVVESKTTAMFRSEDRGETWVETNSSNNNVTVRPFYFSLLVPDPKNSNRIYKPGLSLSVSDDGGKRFLTLGGSYHSDLHALWIDPQDTDHLVLGTDGGVYISRDAGLQWRFVGTLPVSQFYHVSADLEIPYNVYGGLQDNGTWMGPSRAPGGIGNRHWTDIGFGDGFWAFVDPKDDDYVYLEYQGGNILRIRKSTRESKDIKPYPGAGDPKFRCNWNTPIHMSVSQPGTIYFGSQFLFRSRDRGDNWEKISPDLTTNDAAKLKQDESGGVSIDNSSAENHCTIYSICESPKDASVVWVGTDDGNVQVSRDAGKSWTLVSKKIPGLPAASWVSSIEAGRFDAATAFVTFDHHAMGDMKTYVYRTTDYGKTWQPLMTADLEGYAHVVKQDLVRPSLLFLGTELGLFVSIDSGAHWAPIRGEFPKVAVRDLAIHPRDHDLVLATHGRGVWILDDLTGLRAITPEILASDVAFLPSRPAVLSVPAGGQRFDGDDQYVAYGGGDDATISYYLKKRHVVGDLKLEILDPQNTLVATMPSGKRRGINRVTLSTRLKGPKTPPATGLVRQQYSFSGPRLALGDYSVRLTKGENVLTTKVKLVDDPRSPYPAEDRALQQKLVRQLFADIEELSFLVDAMNHSRDAALDRVKGLPEKDALTKRLSAYATRIDAQRDALVSVKEGFITGEEKLRELIVWLYGSVNGYDGRPTGSQVAYAEVLRGELAKVLKQFDQLVNGEGAALSAELEKRKLAPLGPLTKEAWTNTR